MVNHARPTAVVPLTRLTYPGKVRDAIFCPDSASAQLPTVLLDLVAGYLIPDPFETFTEIFCELLPMTVESPAFRLHIKKHLKKRSRHVPSGVVTMVISSTNRRCHRFVVTAKLELRDIYRLDSDRDRLGQVLMGKLGLKPWDHDEARILAGEIIKAYRAAGEQTI